jgi:hypothetical protein
VTLPEGGVPDDEQVPEQGDPVGQVGQGDPVGQADPIGHAAVTTTPPTQTNNNDLGTAVGGFGPVERFRADGNRR